MGRKVRNQHVVVAVALGALLLGAQTAAIGAAHHPATSGHRTQLAATKQQSVRVMTYDIRALTADGTHEGSGNIAPWSVRVRKQAVLIRRAHPDVISIQEGSSYVGHSHTVRQVDSLRHAIGGSYRVARTEIPPNRPRHFRTGDYIIYNRATVKRVHQGAHFSIGNQKYAAYQEFASRGTNAKFLFVSTHLLVGLSHTDDVIRESETKQILSRAGGVAKRRHIPAVYAGNWNSPNPHVGSGKAMHAAHVRDALTVAHKKIRGQYNSDNDYLRRPPRAGVDIDHIYVPAGIKVSLAAIVLKLRHGQFVGAIPSDHNPVVAQLLYPY